MRGTMHVPKRWVLSMVGAALLGLAGCGAMAPAGDGAALTPVPELLLQDAAVTADGRLVPRAWAQLSSAGGGTVAEVLVSPGDEVTAGAALVRLDGGAQAEAALVAAELEQLAALQARQAVDDSAAAEKARALQAWVAARRALSDAESQVAYLESEAPQAEADRADALLVQAEAALEEAQEAYDEVAERDRDDLTRARRQASFAEAQIAYRQAQQASEVLSQERRAETLELARQALAAARQSEQAAEETYVAVADGPDPDVVATADARVEMAAAQVVAAQATLDVLTLRSPLDGTVIEVAVGVGEAVAPTVPVVIVADTSAWLVETDALTQIDVVSIEVGQAVEVVVDALPEPVLRGEVTAIDRIAQEKRGEVTYTVHVRLPAADARLRWGMTCALTFLR